MRFLEYCLNNALRLCKNCSTSWGSEDELEYIVGDKRLGTITRWIDVGGEFSSFKDRSLMKSLNGEVC